MIIHRRIVISEHAWKETGKDVSSRSSSVDDSPGEASGSPPGAFERSRAVLDRYEGPAVLLLVLTALLLRLPLSAGWWLNPDEGIYFRAVADPDFADFWAEATATAHPPLYFLILRGVAAFSTDFVWLRMVAFLCGVAAVGAFVLVGREVGRDGAGRGVVGRWTGLLTGLLIAVSPRAVSLSQVIRPYTLLLLLLSVGLVALLRYVASGSRRWLVAYAVTVSLSLTLHYSAVGALGVFTVVVLADGVRRGFGRPRWTRLALAQVAPVLTIAAVYAWHLRGLMESRMADNALGGWLSLYMIRAPADVWLGLVGVHSSLVGDTLAVSATLLTLLGLAWAAWTRRWTILALGGGALVVAIAGAALHLYPLGATRHASWLFVFLAPVLAWAVVQPIASQDLVRRPRVRATAVAALAVLLVGSAPLSSLLDPEGRPREIAERVLRTGDLETMSDVLSPEAEPRLVLMSTETWEILAPLFLDSKDGMRVAATSGLAHVPFGRRDVLVLPTRDFAALRTGRGQANHLLTAIRIAGEELDVPRPRPGEPVLVLAGGWRSQGMVDLIGLARAQPDLGSATYVPGLISVRLDFEAYRRALGAQPDPPPGQDAPATPGGSTSAATGAAPGPS